MAHDVSEYITYLQKSKYPDTKVLLWLIVSMSAFFYATSYTFTKAHYINTYSYRFEVYAVKNGGYKKFRQKMFKSHKIPGNWLGNFS